MPKAVPASLKPYVFHGIELDDPQPNATHVMADCPMCGRENKFGVNVETGQYKCWVCGEKGNTVEFLRWLWKESEQATNDYEDFAADRSLCYPETLIHWGVCQSVITNDWLVPGFNPQGALCQLYSYRQVAERRLLLLTPTLGHKLLGVNQYRSDREIVFLCEGPWDAMVLWESLCRAKKLETGLSLTSNPNKSLLAECNVLAAPTCTVFFSGWLTLFQGKTVYLMYDNDYPKQHPRTGKQLQPAAYTAMQRVARLLTETSVQPDSVHYLRWGPNGYNNQLAEGADIRDLLTKEL